MLGSTAIILFGMPNRGHYPEPYPGPSNKSMFIDDFVPGGETDVDENKDMRAFIQNYFKSRNLSV